MFYLPKLKGFCSFALVLLGSLLLPSQILASSTPISIEPNIVTEEGGVNIKNGNYNDANVKALITHYYTAIIGRNPETSGLDFWTSEVSRVQSLGIDILDAFRVLAGQFFTSTEYLDKNTSDSQYITDLYRTFFDRNPDSDGLSFWTSNLAAGLPRSVVMFGFLFSSEFDAYMQGLFGATTSRSEIATVVDFYRGFLNRLPDDDGFNYWLARFRTSQCLGASAVVTEIEAISSQFLASSEYTARQRSHRDTIANFYYAFLRRGGDLHGFNYWVNQLDSGILTADQVRQGFIPSTEFQTRINKIIDTGCFKHSAPTANAGLAQSVVAGALVTLDGSASSDADNDPLTFQWTLTAQPAGSSAALSGATTATPTFTADLAGTYVASLVVNDGQLSSTTAFVTITASPAATSTRLYLNYGTSCAAYSPNNNLLCTTFNGLSGLSSRFVSSTSSVEFKTVLAGPMTGTGYGVNIRLVSNGFLYRVRVRIILKRAGVEAVLFESPLEDVFTTHNFVATGAGVAAAGQAGDELIVRTSCAGGQCGIIFGSPYMIGVSVNVNAPSYIEVPQTNVQ